jgi:hypothetical protein
MSKGQGAPAAGAAEKKDHGQKPEAPAGKAAKGHNPLPGGCNSWGCKSSATRFSFCDEHYDHFKFGLIKKTGEPVPDYEKKFEHYRAHRAKRDAQKVA